jgi:hypothetical protein
MENMDHFSDLIVSIARVAKNSLDILRIFVCLNVQFNELCSDWVKGLSYLQGENMFIRDIECIKYIPYIQMFNSSKVVFIQKIDNLTLCLPDLNVTFYGCSNINVMCNRACIIDCSNIKVHSLSELHIMNSKNIMCQSKSGTICFSEEKNAFDIEDVFKSCEIVFSDLHKCEKNGKHYSPRFNYFTKTIKWGDA